MSYWDFDQKCNVEDFFTGFTHDTTPQVDFSSEQFSD